MVTSYYQMEKGLIIKTSMQCIWSISHPIYFPLLNIRLACCRNKAFEERYVQIFMMMMALDQLEIFSINRLMNIINGKYMFSFSVGVHYLGSVFFTLKLHLYESTLFMLFLRKKNIVINVVFTLCNKLGKTSKTPDWKR